MEQKWIPVSERLPEDGDVRFYMCIVENHEEDLPMFCQYAEEHGFGFWRDYYDADTLGFVDSEFQTNADRIRSMTDEELLDFLCSIETYEQGSAKTIEGGVAMCSVTDVEQWLKAESEG